MTNNSTDHMTTKHKVVITAGRAQLVLESGTEPVCLRNRPASYVHKCFHPENTQSIMSLTSVRQQFSI